MMTEVEARAKGAAMMRKLKGSGWKLDIWENLGWHCAALNKFISVHEHDGRYSTLLSIDPDKRGSGEIYWPSNGSFDNPQEAVEEQMKVARAYMNRMRRAVNYVEKAALGMRR